MEANGNYYQTATGQYMLSAAPVANHTQGPIRHAQDASQRAYYNAVNAYRAPLEDIDKKIGAAISAAKFSTSFIVGSLQDMNAREHKDIISLIRILTARGYEVRYINRTVQKDEDGGITYSPKTELVVEFPPAKGSMMH